MSRNKHPQTNAGNSLISNMSTEILAQQMSVNAKQALRNSKSFEPLIIMLGTVAMLVLAIALTVLLTIYALAVMTF